MSGCGSAFAAGAAGTGPPKNTLSYWNLFGGGDGVRMQAMERGYQKQHPSINLNAVTLAWGNPYYTKLSLATLGDRPPDVAISHLTRASILAQAGLLEPLNEAELAPYGLTGGHFTPAAWQKAHTDGKLYAIPLDTHPFVMYYNTDIYKKAGLLGKDYPGAITTFATGKAGFYFEGDWEITTFETTKTPFSMTAFPNVFGGKYAVQADSHSFVLPKDQERTDAMRQQIFGFIRSMLNQSSTWAQGGHIPAWLPYQKSAAYDKLKPASNYKWVANYAHYDDRTWHSGSGSDFENIMGFAIAAVSAVQMTPAAAVSDMRSRLAKYANTPSPV